jgi:hypothetical protein
MALRPSRVYFIVMETNLWTLPQYVAKHCGCVGKKPCVKYCVFVL